MDTGTSMRLAARRLGYLAGRLPLWGLLLLGAACDSFGSAVQSPDQDRKQYDETEKALLINRTEFATQQYREPYAVENTLFLYDYGSTGVHLHGYNKPLNRHVDYTFTVINNDAYGFEASDALVAPRNSLNSAEVAVYSTAQPQLRVDKATFGSDVDGIYLIGSTVYVVSRDQGTARLYQWTPGSASQMLLSLQAATGLSQIGTVRRFKVQGTRMVFIEGYSIWRLSLVDQRATRVMTLPAIFGSVQIHEDGVMYQSSGRLRFVDLESMQQTDLSDLIKESPYRLSSSFAEGHHFYDGYARYGRWVVYGGRSGIFAYHLDSGTIRPVLLNPRQTTVEVSPFTYRRPVTLKSGFMYVTGEQGNFGNVYEVDLGKALQ